MTDAPIDEVQVLTTGAVRVRVRSGTSLSFPRAADGHPSPAPPGPLTGTHRQPVLACMQEARSRSPRYPPGAPVPCPARSPPGCGPQFPPSPARLATEHAHGHPPHHGPRRPDPPFARRCAHGRQERPMTRRGRGAHHTLQHPPTATSTPHRRVHT